MLKDLNSLHHAYFIVGSADAAERELHAFFQKEGIKLLGSPDFFLWTGETFGIDDARDLSVSAVKKAFIDRKVFFIAPAKITLEAQNALLKTFEEPVANTHFFLCLPDAGMIIPTLLSRMQTVRLKGEEETNEAENFLKLPLKGRLVFVKKFVDEEKNISAFLDLLLSYMRDKKASLESVEKVYKMRLRSDDRGVSPRLILEHLALVI